ncbi:MAG: carbohydrate kinase family protein [Spirochaetia bacterium]|jgi:sugar/nucleoside kinase (ribokinase family)|nr:carbohydrate kinase family protein [Spirochaetia bacterium]
MRINGLGCSLVDNLYSPIDFSSKAYKKWTSDNNPSGGIITGGLVFGESLEISFGVKYQDLLTEITGGRISPEKNIGGPSIVALINIAQMLGDKGIDIGFYGARAEDENGQFIAEKLAPFNINLDGYLVLDGQTPFTDVLSDPAFNDNNGERSFINYIGAAGKISGRDIPDSFFDADILIYGGTALTPGLHDDLSFLLRKGKRESCFNFINTVYDFRNQNLNPHKPWPLVSTKNDYKLIDLLIADNEEAMRISGQLTKEDTLRFFAEKGVRSVIITHGSADVLCYSDGSLFKEEGTFTMPVSGSAGNRIRNLPADSLADTTGCGDNFAGGVYASIAIQLKDHNDGKLSLKEAAAWGVVSGGLAGLYQGGVYYEEKKGEKLEKLEVLFGEYKQQTGWSEASFLLADATKGVEF